MALLLVALSASAKTQRGTVSTPWSGAAAITETTAQIMARHAALRILQPNRAPVGRHPLRVANRRYRPQRGSPKRSVDALLPPLLAAQTPGLTFNAFNSSPTDGPFPPNPSGAIGPSQFLMASEGGVITFNRNTGLADGQLNLSLDEFFHSVRNGFSTFEPRVRYDRLSGRWFVTAINSDYPNRVLFAVSNGPAISVSTVWSFFYFQQDIGSTIDTACIVDSPTLAIDVNALYVGADKFCSPDFDLSDSILFVVRKSSLLGAGPIVATAFRSLNGQGTGIISPQGVDNLDPNATEGYVVGVDYESFGVLDLRRIIDPGGMPVLSPNLSLMVLQTAYPNPVPHLGNTAGVQGYLDGGDDRVTSAQLRNGSLWMVQATSVDDGGFATFSSNRNALRWYELQGIANGQTTNFNQIGTVFVPGNPDSFDQRNYWMPSLAVSGQGHVAMGFSSAGTNEYINAAVTGRLASDASGFMSTPLLYTASSSAYNPPGDNGNDYFVRLWGSYSSTSVDPNDDMTLWTMQQFASAPNTYGLQVLKWMAPPPAALISVTPALAPGLAAAEVVVTGSSAQGSGFYDPGPGFANRLSASATGGVTVNKVTFLNPTTLALTVSTAAASTGSYSLTVINPDGQSVTAASIFTVSASGCSYSISPTTVTQPFPASGGTGSVTVTAGAGCAWTATSESAFLTVTSGANGSGNGMVQYALTANPSTNSRSGILDIAGQTFTISEAGLFPTTLAVSTSSNPVILSQPLTLTATITPAASGGKVTFYDGANVIGIAPVAGGTASLTTRLLPAGVRTLRAHFSGVGVTAASNSPSVSQTIAARVQTGLQPPILAALGINTGNEPWAVTADFDGDGKLDFAGPAIKNQPYLSVVLGKGDGTFQSLSSYPAEYSNGKMFAADFNGDGKTDLIAVLGGGFSIFLGNGDGSFQAPIHTFLPCYDATIGDFNGDGIIDIVAVAVGSTVMTVLFGNGDGTFRSAITIGGVANSFVGYGRVWTADFNGDGKADLLLDEARGDQVVWLGNGDGTFVAQSPMATGLATLNAVSDDLNGDGKADLVLATAHGVMVYLGNGDGTFREPTAYLDQLDAYTAAIGDFNGDGKLDLVALGSGGTGDGVSVSLGNGDGTFQLPKHVAQYTNGGLIVGDLNGDGRTDLVVTSANEEFGFSFFLFAGAIYPDLAIVASHTGDFTQGQMGASYTLSVANPGTSSTTGTVTVTDTLPDPLTATAIGGTGWSCSLGTLTCTRSDSLAAGANYPPIVITVNVANNAPAAIGNTASVRATGDPNPANDVSMNPTTVTQVSLLYAKRTAALPGATASVPLTLGLPGGVAIDSLTFTVTLAATGGAPALATPLSFANDAAQPAPVASGVTAATITLTYTNLAASFTASRHLGDLVVSIPASATPGQLYSVHLSGIAATLAGNGVTVGPGADVDVIAGVTYIVGDVFPFSGNAGGNFGDGTVNTLDLLAVLRAVTGIAAPASCSDLSDAMDAFPIDTMFQRGGDGMLNTLDLLAELRRVTNTDTSRPTRYSGGRTCNAAAPQSRLENNEASLEFGEAQQDGRSWRTPVYLRSTVNLDLAGLAFSVASDGPLSFVHVAGATPPSLLDQDLPGVVAMAWLSGLKTKPGDRLLLGYVETPASAATLRFVGVSANASESGRDISIATIRRRKP